MNEIAKAQYDRAIGYLNAADTVDDLNNSIMYTGMAECALNLARFAVENPALVAGVDEFAPPMPTADSPVPQQPSQGPRFWGAPTP